ncbi:MAG TPA: universal stress protein [Acidimicrobiia bacterium]|jgi:nucleotide-binding universal stress UspA family protein|nr:universal stress protein [Acidimicrobiia bacterium]
MRKIVVGTDGSEHATCATRWALEEARVHRADVEIVLVWSYGDQHHIDRRDRFDPDYSEEAAQATLAAWVAEAIGDDDAVAVTQRVVLDLPVRALLEAGDGADLLVVGARRDGGLRRAAPRVGERTRRPTRGAPRRGHPRPGAGRRWTGRRRHRRLRPVARRDAVGCR